MNIKLDKLSLQPQQIKHAKNAKVKRNYMFWKRTTMVSGQKTLPCHRNCAGVCVGLLPALLFAGGIKYLNFFSSKTIAKVGNAHSTGRQEMLPLHHG